MADSDNVVLAVGGNFLTSATGVTAPTTASASWGVGWNDLGYLSEDGITESSEEEWIEIKAWQNGDIVRRQNSSSSLMFSFTAIETNATTVGLFYPGSDLVGTGADDGPATLTIRGPQPDRRAFGFDLIDGTRRIRTVIPIGEMGEKGEPVFKTDEAIGYEMTVTAYPASNGIRALRYYSDLPGIEGI